MKKLALLGGLALSLMASSLFAADKPLRLGIEAAYPPFAFKQADGSIAGFDVDIGVALCAEMKVECQWVEQEFDGLIPSLKVKKVDAVLSSLTITGISTWILAALIVWLAGAIAAFILPFLLVKRVVEERRA